MVLGFSELEVQKAKDFIWNLLEEEDKNIMIELANTDKQEREGMYVKKMIGYLKKDGLADTKEVFILGRSY